MFVLHLLGHSRRLISTLGPHSDPMRDIGDEVRWEPSSPAVSSRDPGLTPPTPFSRTSPVLQPSCSGGAAAAALTQPKLSISSPCWVCSSSWRTRCGCPGSPERPCGGAIPWCTGAGRFRPPNGTRVDNIQPGGSPLSLRPALGSMPTSVPTRRKGLSLFQGARALKAP